MHETKTQNHFRKRARRAIAAPKSTLEFALLLVQLRRLLLRFPLHLRRKKRETIPKRLAQREQPAPIEQARQARHLSSYCRQQQTTKQTNRFTIAIAAIVAAIAVAAVCAAAQLLPRVVARSVAAAALL